MAIEEALFTKLSGTSAVSDLIGSSPCRLYPVKKSLADPTFPYVTYERISSERHSAMGSDTGQATAEWRFHAWGQTTTSSGGFSSSRAVLTAIRETLQRFRGTVSSTEIQAVFVIDEFDIGEDEQNIYHRCVDFSITWVE